MTATYVETSALLAWVYDEESAPRIGEALETSDGLVASSLTAVEARRALARDEATNVHDARRRRAHAGRLSIVLDALMEMDLTDSVRERCARPFPVEPIRNSDAVHLATALEFLELYPDLRVLTLDWRVRENAEALGLDSV